MADKNKTPNRKGFLATYTGDGPDHGKKYRWYFYRDPQHNLWFLVDEKGYERALERTWNDSVPRIQEIISNHGMTCNIS